jgi:hypothetical protein
MNRVDKLWNALGKAVRAGASTKQVDHIAAQLDRARGQRGD